jgi:hypothetical protein
VIGVKDRQIIAKANDLGREGRPRFALNLCDRANRRRKSGADL